MRLSESHLVIIEQAEAHGYVWLSHLPKNAQMRFRYRTRNGFKGYIKIDGLTFLTIRVAEAMIQGTADKHHKRLTLVQQNERLEDELQKLEKLYYTAIGLGGRKVRNRCLKGVTDGDRDRELIRARTGQPYSKSKDANNSD